MTGGVGRLSTSWLAVVCLGIVFLLGLGAWATGHAAHPEAATADQPTTWNVPSAGMPTTDRTAVTKLLVVVVENRAFTQIWREMPYVHELAVTYGYANNYHALAHPSLPNYLAMAGGDTFGVDDDNPPADHRLKSPSVFGQAVKVGKTARIYAEAMSTNCQRRAHDRYAVKHNPWPYFVDEATMCGHDDVPLSRLTADIQTGQLPAVGMVIPDLCNDAHDCSSAHADKWMRKHLGAVFNGSDWASGELAVIVTADEDDRHHDNRILTVVAHPSLRHVVAKARLDHYSLSRAYADVAGIDALGKATKASSLLTAFGLGAG